MLLLNCLNNVFHVIIPFIYKNIITINVHLSLYLWSYCSVCVCVCISLIYIHTCILQIEYFIVTDFSLGNIIFLIKQKVSKDEIIKEAFGER